MSTTIRIGTRGSDLALSQARDVAARLEEHAGVASETVVIQTTGDREADAPMTPGVWETGAFVTAIEHALADGRVDLAVHSHKDLATVSLPGLVIVANPPRAPVHDVLVASSAQVAAELNAALAGESPGEELRIGTSSPRRAAQLRRALGCRIEPIRGNVPTRMAIATGGKLDAVCLAAAGLQRLGLAPEHAIALPIDRFPTAPAQGAVAVQAREGTPAAALGPTIDHGPTRRCTAAERAFLATINAGCHAPVAASATVEEAGTIRLHVQLFKDDGELYEERAVGDEPRALGLEVGKRALAWIGA